MGRSVEQFWPETHASARATCSSRPFHRYLSSRSRRQQRPSGELSRPQAMPSKGCVLPVSSAR